MSSDWQDQFTEKDKGTLGRAILKDALQALLDEVGIDEFRIITAEVRKRMVATVDGDMDAGLPLSKWIETIAQVYEERHPESK